MTARCFLQFNHYTGKGDVTMLAQCLVLLIAASGALSSTTAAQGVGMTNVNLSTIRQTTATTSVSILTTEQSTTNFITSEGSAVTTSETETSMDTKPDSITTNSITVSADLTLAVQIAASITALTIIGAVIGLLLWIRRRRRIQKIDPTPLAMPQNNPRIQTPETSRSRPGNDNYLSVDEINIPSSMTESSALDGKKRDSGLHDSDGYLLMAPGPIAPKEPKYQNVEVKTVRLQVVKSYDNAVFTSDQSKTEKTSKKNVEQPKMEVNTNRQDPDETDFDDNAKLEIEQSELATCYPEPNNTCFGGNGHSENVKKSGSTLPEPDKTYAVKPGVYSSKGEANIKNIQPELSHPGEYQTGSKRPSAEPETESSQSELDETSSNNSSDISLDDRQSTDRPATDITASPPLPPRALGPGFRHANHPAYDWWGTEGSVDNTQ